MRVSKAVVFSVLIMAAAPPLHAADTAPRDAFWEALSALCGQAFSGRLAAYDEALDSDWLPERMVIHVRRCSDNEIQVPLFVGDDRSRTWVLSRTGEGLRLKHDHRHEDGSEDALTWYGGHSTDPGRAWRQVFPADDYSRALFLSSGLEASVNNLWYMEVKPGQYFAYGLVRSGRHLRAEFDLSAPVDAPPAPWGHD